MAKKRRSSRKRVATRQDITVRNRRAIDKQMEAMKRSLMSHIEDLKEAVASIERKVSAIEPREDKR